MKYLFLLFIIIMAFMPAVSQTLRIADNNANAPTGALVYPGVQEAIDAADPGDIIYVTPSPTIYPAVNIQKEVTLLGLGYNPETTFSYTSTINNIYIDTKEASGTTISGIQVGPSTTDARFSGRIEIATNHSSSDTIRDITIEKCIFSILVQVSSTMTVDGLKIINCITFNNTSGSIGLRTDERIVNAVIANNILQNFTIRSDIGIISAGNFTVIKNNVFLGVDNSNLASFAGLENCLVTDNIFYGRTAWTWGSTTSQLNTFSNNLTFGLVAGFENLPPPGSPQPNIDGLGNQENVDPLFTNFPFGIWSFDHDIRLMAGSPALGAGLSGGDLGPLGGEFPIEINENGSPIGQPVPVITSVSVPALLNEGESLQVTIDAKGN